MALLAAGTGVFWQGSGESYPFDTLRGETVMIIGQILGGVNVALVTSIIFVLISFSGIILGIVTLKNIRE